MPHFQFRTLGVALFALGLAACGDTSDPTTVPQQPQPSAVGSKVQPRYVFTFRAGITSAFTTRVTALGGKVSFSDDKLGFAAVSGLSASEAQSLVRERLAATAEVEPVLQLSPVQTEKTTLRQSGRVNSPLNPAAAFLMSTDPVIQWNMIAVHADDAWAAGKLGSSSVSVGILDTGLDYTHPDLAGHVDLGRSADLVGEADSIAKYFGAGLHPISDLNGHGSHTGTVVSSNAFISAGITSQTTLVGVKVCTMRGACPLLATLAGIRYAADAGVQVINLSLGFGVPKSLAPGLSSIVNNAFNYAKRKGVLIVVAAGNSAVDMDHDGNTFWGYCSAPHVVCVSAVGPTGESQVGPFVNLDAFASFYSNFGRSAITVAAPGGNVIVDGSGNIADITPVWGTCSTTALGFASLTPAPTDPPIGLLCSPAFLPIIGFVGTSEAAPHVTGLAASLAAEGVRGPSALRAAILKGADDLGTRGTDPFYGKGRINVAASLGVP